MGNRLCCIPKKRDIQTDSSEEEVANQKFALKTADTVQLGCNIEDLRESEKEGAKVKKQTDSVDNAKVKEECKVQNAKAEDECDVKDAKAKGECDVENAKTKKECNNENAKAEEKCAVENAKAKEECYIENAKAKDECDIENAKAKEECYIENAKAREECVIENAKAKEECVIENAKAKEECDIENTKAKEECVIENAKAKDECDDENAKAKDECDDENVKAKEGCVIENAKAREECVIDNAKAKEECVIENAKAKDECDDENAKAEEGSVIENAKAKDECDDENSKAKDECDDENAKAKEGCVIENANAKDERDDENANTKEECVIDNAKAKDWCDDENAKAKAECDVGNVNAKDECDVENVKAKDKCDDENAKPKEECQLENVKAKDECDVGNVKAKFESYVENAKVNENGMTSIFNIENARSNVDESSIGNIHGKVAISHIKNARSSVEGSHIENTSGKVDERDSTIEITKAKEDEINKEEINVPMCGVVAERTNANGGKEIGVGSIRIVENKGNIQDEAEENNKMAEADKEEISTNMVQHNGTQRSSDDVSGKTGDIISVIAGNKQERDLNTKYKVGKEIDNVEKVTVDENNTSKTYANDSFVDNGYPSQDNITYRDLDALIEDTLKEMDRTIRECASPMLDRGVNINNTEDTNYISSSQTSLNSDVDKTNSFSTVENDMVSDSESNGSDIGQDCRDKYGRYRDPDMPWDEDEDEDSDDAEQFKEGSVETTGEHEYDYDDDDFETYNGDRYGRDHDPEIKWDFDNDEEDICKDDIARELKDDIQSTNDLESEEDETEENIINNTRLINGLTEDDIQQRREQLHELKILRIKPKLKAITRCIDDPMNRYCPERVPHTEDDQHGSIFEIRRKRDMVLGKREARRRRQEKILNKTLAKLSEDSWASSGTYHTYISEQTCSSQDTSCLLNTEEVDETVYSQSHSLDTNKSTDSLRPPIPHVTQNDILQYVPTPPTAKDKIIQHVPAPPTVKDDILRCVPKPPTVKDNIVQHVPAPPTAKGNILQYVPRPPTGKENIVQHVPTPPTAKCDTLKYVPTPPTAKCDILKYVPTPPATKDDILQYVPPPSPPASRVDMLQYVPTSPAVKDNILQHLTTPPSAKDDTQHFMPKPPTAQKKEDSYVRKGVSLRPIEVKSTNMKTKTDHMEQQFNKHANKPPFTGSCHEDKSSSSLQMVGRKTHNQTGSSERMIAPIKCQDENNSIDQLQEQDNLYMPLVESRSCRLPSYAVNSKESMLPSLNSDRESTNKYSRHEVQSIISTCDIGRDSTQRITAELETTSNLPKLNIANNNSVCNNRAFPGNSRLMIDSYDEFYDHDFGTTEMKDPYSWRVIELNDETLNEPNVESVNEGVSPGGPISRKHTFIDINYQM